MTKYIWFDMDGTLVDFYGVDGWLEDLINERTRPYDIAMPRFNFSAFARIVNRLQRQGYEIGIISWLSKSGSAEFNEMVTKAKLNYLAKHLPSVHWDCIHIVKYGTPKHTLGQGILFDDEIGNREAWGVGAYDVYDILEVLKNL